MEIVGAPDRSDLEREFTNSAAPGKPFSGADPDALFDALIDVEKQLRDGGYQQQLEELGL